MLAKSKGLACVLQTVRGRAACSSLAAFSTLRNPQTGQQCLRLVFSKIPALLQALGLMCLVKDNVLHDLQGLELQKMDPMCPAAPATAAGSSHM